MRGVLEKLGIEPEVRRIGTFKSAGDQLLRKDMSDSQREQLTAILEDVTLGFMQTIAEARGKSIEEVCAPGVSLPGTWTAHQLRSIFICLAH